MEYIVAFHSTHQAMEMEAWVKEQGLKARLIPTPEAVSASCGLALKYQAADQAIVWQQLRSLADPAVNCYEIVIVEGRKTYRLQGKGELNE